MVFSGVAFLFEPLANRRERPKARLPTRPRAGSFGRHGSLDRIDVAERILGIETFELFEAFDVRDALVGMADEGRHGERTERKRNQATESSNDALNLAQLRAARGSSDYFGT